MSLSYKAKYLSYFINYIRSVRKSFVLCQFSNLKSTLNSLKFVDDNFRGLRKKRKVPSIRRSLAIVCTYIHILFLISWFDILSMKSMNIGKARKIMNSHHSNLKTGSNSLVISAFLCILVQFCIIFFLCRYCTINQHIIFFTLYHN